MDHQNILIIGANSDLISPFTDLAIKHNFNLLRLTRDDWDLCDPSIPQALLSQLITFKPNHILYSAGLNQVLDLKQSTKESTLAKVLDHLNVNCLSLLSIILSLSEHLTYPLKSIHAISSLYGIYGRKTRLPYSLSKHALEGLIKCLALELPDTLVLGYRPGFFSTKLTDQNLSKEAQNRLVARVPMGRFGQPKELSTLILNNILSPPLYCSGSSITMDGGLTAGGLFHN